MARCALHNLRVTRKQRLFGLVVLAQAAHSTEEYLFRLWETLPPARLISSLIDSDLERGFVIFNLAVFVFGVWTFFWPVRRNWPAARAIMWGWAIVEIANGFVHPFWSLRQGMYTAGTVTAPIVGILGFLLARELLRTRSNPAF
ncbi:MAG: hypothetical protein WD690_17985 [Vicinamibacterales bacterium]